MNDMFPKTAKKSGTNVTFDLWFEDFLLSHPPFFDHFETFCSLDPRRKCRLSDEKMNKNRLKMGKIKPFGVL